MIFKTRMFKRVPQFQVKLDQISATLIGSRMFRNLFPDVVSCREARKIKPACSKEHQQVTLHVAMRAQNMLVIAGLLLHHSATV